jgi:formylglycine-generating enzyme required for sulfatase activity
MVLVPGGTYQMGSADADDQQPVHPCTVDPFYMAIHPVTNEEYRAFVLTEGHPPPKPSGDQYAIWEGTRFPHEQARRPVVLVSWEDAAAYCQWLSDLTGAKIRLPSEAEWERAARGGLEGKRYPWGDDEPEGRAAYDLLWTGPNVIPEVCCGEPNGYGLYDMAGLIWEWCWDFYHRRYYELPEASEPNPVNEAPALQRVQRGGAWLTGARMLRSAYRGKHRPDAATIAFGFRIVREP